MSDQARHPWVKLAVGRRGSGKSYRTIQEIRSWRLAHAESPQWAVLGVDPVASSPPRPEHVAAWCDIATPTLESDLIPPDVGLVAVDEADQSISQSDARVRPTPPLIDLVRRGRHRGVSLMLATQRPALVLYDVWSLADEVVICQLTGKRDLDRVCELEGVARYRELIATTCRPGPIVIWTPFGVRLVR